MEDLVYTVLEALDLNQRERYPGAGGGSCRDESKYIPYVVAYLISYPPLARQNI